MEKIPEFEIEMCCKICAFYQPDETRKNQGICRRYPPVMHLIPGPQKAVQMPGMSSAIQIQAQSLFPTTHENNVCGECQIPAPLSSLDS